MLTSTVRGLATITVTSTTIVAIADHAVKDSSPYYRLLPGNEPVRRAAAEEISVRACSVAVVVSRVRRSSEEPAWPYQSLFYLIHPIFLSFSGLIGGLFDLFRAYSHAYRG